MSTASSDHSLSPDVPGAFSAASFARPVITLTADQAEAKTIELRDPDGKLVGILLRDSDATIFYTPARIAELQRRAASPERGRPLREVLESLAERIAKLQEPQTGA